MDIKPVKSVEKPKYPLKDEVSRDALKKSIPKRWAGSTAAKVALGALATAALAGCTPHDLPTAGVPEPPSATVQQTVCPTVTEYRTEGIAAAPTVNVAPMFLHGEGRGAYGCVMVAPPVFLSEEDALAVINETAKEYGLEFTIQGSPELSNVPKPVTNIYEPGDIKPSDETMSFKTDFTDSEHGVLIEFVTVDDVKSWHVETDYAISVEQYDTQGAAEQLSEGLEQSAVNDGYYNAAVLYDPCESFQPEDISDEEAWNQAEARSREMSEEQLKKQARDFFEWLKSQGII